MSINRRFRELQAFLPLIILDAFLEALILGKKSPRKIYRKELVMVPLNNDPWRQERRHQVGFLPLGNLFLKDCIKHLLENPAFLGISSRFFLTGTRIP